MHYTQQPNLPASPDQVDQRTINPNLPTGNDVRCFLTPGPRAQDIAPYCIGAFRKAAQDRIDRSKVHTIVYNLLSSNYFQNQMFGEWVQRSVDYTEFLIVTQNLHPQQAADQAATMIYACFFAVVVSQHFQAFSQAQILTQAMVDEATRFAGEFEQIQRVLIQFKQQMQQPQYGAPAYAAHNAGSYAAPGHHQPAYVAPVTYSVTPSGVTHHGVNPLDRARAAAVPYSAPQPLYSAPGASGTPAPLARGRVDDYVTAPAPQAAPAPGVVDPYARLAPQPLKPIETFGSNTGGRVVRDITPARNLAPILEYSTNPAPQQAVAQEQAPSTIEMGYDDATLPAPSNLGEVIINADYYRPEGVEPAKVGREYDLVYNPGGVLIVPAHLSEWKRTWSIESPYALNAIPNTEIKWHVKWPDGLVQEVVTAVEPGMAYLRHELLLSLQVSKKHDKHGKVIPDLRGVQELDHFSDANLSIPTDNHDLVEVPKVVILEGPLDDTGRHLDNACQAAEILRAEYELGDSDALPVHQYVTLHEEPLVFGTKSERMEVQRLASCESLQELAQEMLLLIESGVLQERHARLLNDRMTLAVNQLLSDSLALPSVKITNFIDDIDELLEHLVKKCGQGILNTIAQFSGSVISTWMHLTFGTIEVEGDTEGETKAESNYDVLYLLDRTANLQTNYTVGELGRMPLNNNEAVLVSSAQHPNLYKLIVGFIKSNREQDVPGNHLTLITADGVRISVVIGWLRQGAVLLRRQQQVA